MNCLRSLKYIKKVNLKYKKYGLNTILLHTHEWEFEKNRKDVLNALNKLKIKFPIIIDDNKKITEKLKVNFWPAQILIKNSKIIYRHIGEGNYRKLEEKILDILKIKSKKVFNSEPKYSKLPAIYLGKRKKGKIKLLSKNIKFGVGYKEGKWVQTNEYLQHIGKNGSLAILTKGNVINFTASPVNDKATVLIKLNDRFNKKLVINKPDIYEIAKIKRNKKHELMISTKSGLKVYSFSFQ